MGNSNPYEQHDLSQLLQTMENKLFLGQQKNEDPNENEQLLASLCQKLNTKDNYLQILKLRPILKCAKCNVSENIEDKRCITLECECCYCSECLQKKSYQDTQNTLENLEEVKCECNQQIKEIYIYKSFTNKQIFNNKREIIRQQKLQELLDPSEYDKLKPKFQCLICYSDKNIEDSITLECNHRFCKDCFIFIVQDCIKKQQVESLKCPTLECQTEITVFEIKNWCSEEVYDRYLILKLQKTQFVNQERLKLCPALNCDGSLVIPFKQKIFSCPKCHQQVCSECNVNHPENQLCNQGQESQQVFIQGNGIIGQITKLVTLSSLSHMS